MIAECRAYLEQQLRIAMGNTTKIVQTFRELSINMESHIGSVLTDNESFTPCNIKAKTVDGSGLATKVYSRELRFTITMGEYTLEALEPMFEAFLRTLRRRLQLQDGSWVELSIGDAEWIFKEDNVLKSNISVVLPVTCSGGLWMPMQTRQLTDTKIEVEVDHVRKDNC